MSRVLTAFAILRPSAQNVQLIATNSPSIHSRDKMTLCKFCLLFAIVLGLSACSSPSVLDSPGVPEPICVLENPDTGERVRLYKEISFKVSSDYDEQKHIADWTLTQNKYGCKKQISPEDDRKQLAAEREKNATSTREAQ